MVRRRKDTASRPMCSASWRIPLLVLLLLPLLAAGPEGDLPADPRGDFQSVTIPLKRVGRLFLIEARIGDQTGNFVFDTGASKLVLNRTYFRKDLAPVDERAGGVTGSIDKVFQTHVDRIDLNGLWYENVQADVVSLAHIENRRGVKILGLFGMSMFRTMEMVIDFRRGELQLFRVNRDGSRADSTSGQQNDLVAPLREAGGVVFMQAIVGGKGVDFCLDTGAEANVLSSSAPKKVLGSVTITRRSGLTGSGPASAEVLFGTMNDFILSGKQLHPMQTMITGLESLAMAYDYPLGGVLGYDFFEKGVVSVNLVRKELGLSLVKEAEQ